MKTKTMTPDKITFGQEAELLAILYSISGGTWGCYGCSRQITTMTGWKPRLAFVGDSTETRRVIIDIFCNNCLPFPSVFDDPTIIKHALDDENDLSEPQND